jgi:ribonuclease E
VLNQKRAHLRALEEHFAITIMVIADETVAAPQAFVVDRGEQVHSPEQARAIAEQHQAEAAAAPLEEEDDLEDESIVDEVEEEQAAEAEAEAGASLSPPENSDGEPPRRRRRRRGRGGRNGRDNGEQRRYEQIPINDDGNEPAGEHFVSSDDAAAGDHAAVGPQGEPDSGEREERPEYHGERQGPDAEGRETDGGRRRRRRGRRGGRNRQENRQENPQENRQENRQELGGNGGYSPDDQQPQHDFAPGDQFPTPAASEPVAHDTGADFVAASPAPAPAPVIPKPSLPEPEAPRRRSTVREPAPVSSGESFAPTPSPTLIVTPAPEPAVETITTEEANKPRKTGWWSKRFGG